VRLPRLRFTVRLFMLVVALAACSVWGYRMWRVSRERAREERLHTHYRIGHPSPSADAAEKAAYDAVLARKYERAARYPWLPVEPDPPQP
jgi:hypothetical protein